MREPEDALTECAYGMSLALLWDVLLSQRNIEACSFVVIRSAFVSCFCATSVYEMKGAIHTSSLLDNFYADHFVKKQH